MSNTVVTRAFGQEGNIFNICCSTGEILLDFLMVIITANVFLTSSQDLVYDVTLAQQRAGAYHSGRKKSTIYLVWRIWQKNKPNENNLLTNFWGRML